MTPFLLRCQAVLAALLALGGTVHAAEISPLPSAESAGWKPLSQDDGIVAFEKNLPGSDIVALRGEGIVAAPIENVASVIYDTPHAHEWVADLEEARILHWINPFEYVEYDHIGTPFVMKDRDFVSHAVIDYDPAKRTFRYTFDAMDDPQAPKTGHVRGELHDTQFFLVPTADGKGTWVLGEAHADPKGSVPKWIVNLFQKGWPIDTIKSLRKQVLKRGQTVDPKVAEIIKLKTQAKGGAASTASSTQ